MAAWVARAALACWCACALTSAESKPEDGGFGERIRPRVPAAFAPRLKLDSPSPRHAPAAPHYTEEAYEEYDEQVDSLDDLPDPPPPPVAPRRPARTEAHRLEMSTEYFMLPERASAAPSPPKRAASTPAPRPPNSTVLVKSQFPPNVGALRQEPWAVPILALACACMLTIGGFEVFVVYGASRKAPSHRHLLLGQTLLFGLFTCAATAAMFATTPTAFSCGAVRFGTGVSYVIVFASLLVKCVFLLSLNGGVYLPAAYQGLLLFFAVMIQVAIGAQWLGGSPPRVSSDGAQCEGALADLLMSLCYAAFLIAVVCGVALRSRGIRDNYREATHIAGASGAAAAVWVCWLAAALGAPERHRAACVAAGLLATCACVFALMFAPKGRRLAALGREGRWDADREEGLSSLGAGAGGSGYSPSFFHFKPVKYGMVSPAAAPAPPADRKEPPAQPADPYGALFANSPHLHSRLMYSPPHYPMHHPFHYPYNYPPYPYLLPPGADLGVMMRGEEGNVYTSVEPTFSSNPNVYFQRSEPLHAGMMY